MAFQADVTKHMLHRPILSRRISEWAYTLIDCGLALEPLSILKSQILINLIFEHGIDLGDKINYLFATHGGFISISRLAKRAKVLA
jgi:glyoxylase-like metal-dependent hydrolase (beta-lactamase superfamily II)